MVDMPVVKEEREKVSKEEAEDIMVLLSDANLGLPRFLARRCGFMVELRVVPAIDDDAMALVMCSVST